MTLRVLSKSQQKKQNRARIKQFIGRDRRLLYSRSNVPWRSTVGARASQSGLAWGLTLEPGGRGAVHALFGVARPRQHPDAKTH